MICDSHPHTATARANTFISNVYANRYNFQWFIEFKKILIYFSLDKSGLRFRIELKI